MDRLARTVLLCLAPSLLSASLLAAPLLAQDLMVGVKGGAVSSNLLVDVEGVNVSDFIDSRTGLAGGGFLSLQGSGWLGFQLEGLYVEKGLSGAAQGLEGELKLTYFEFPVLLRAALPTGTVRPVLFAGPAIALESGCRVAATFQGERFEEDCETADTGELADTPGRRSMDIGAVIGGGIEAGTGSVSLVLDARYTRGLRTLDETDVSDIKNEAFVFLAGVGFRLGKRASAP